MKALAFIELNGRRIGPGNPCFIVAEAGVNHNGDMKLARQLIDAAAQAGADAIKFQSFKADQVISAAAPKAKYQLETTDPGESQLEMVRQLELPREVHAELQQYCRQQGILFMSTPFDTGSVDLLDELKVPLLKIPSGEVTNWSFLKYVAAKGKPIILSTGMAYLSEVEAALRVIYSAGNEQVILLHCVSNYPAPAADINLRALQTMAAAFRVPVGYSDHTLGLEASLTAVALGASVIEKHFTLDKTLPGPDHRASLEPDELQALVAGIRRVEVSLGDGIKQPAPSETDNRLIIRRSLAASSDLAEGTILTAEVLTALRPATGISPELLDQVVGRRLRRAIKRGQIIAWDDLQ